MKTIHLEKNHTGFCGFAYVSEASCGKAVIVVTGSDGGIENAKYIANLFAQQGFLALAVGYFGLSGLPKALSLIPLETVENAIRWVRAYGEGDIQHISAYGLSKGAEMVLLSSIFFKEIKRVVAVVPNCFVGEGIHRGLPPYTKQSAWTYRGQPLPYAPMALNAGAFFRASLCNRELRMAAFYDCAIARGIPADAWIPIEESGAEILLFSAEEDSMWPSQWACERMMERLERAKYRNAFQHVCFSPASHLLSPMPVEKAKRMGKVMRVERLFPHVCQEAREKAFSLSVRWIKGYGLDAADV